MGTPSARGLFRGAIAQSGAAETVLSADAAAQVAERFVAECGVAAGDLDALLALPVQSLLDAQQSLSTKLAKEADLLLPFAPVVEPAVLPVHPLAAIRSGSGKGVHLLTGTTADEWNLFHVMSKANGAMDDAGLRRRVVHAIGEERADAVIETYRAGRPGESADDLWCAMATDRVFRAPCAHLAEAQAEHEPDTYVYEFTFRSTAFGGNMGACHAIDVPFVFDNVDRRGVEFLLGEIDDGIRQLSRVTSRAWLAMATNGTPQHDELPEWPAYRPDARNVMELGLERVVHDDPRPAERESWPTPAKPPPPTTNVGCERCEFRNVRSEARPGYVRSASTSADVGRDGSAPGTVTAWAPAAEARRSASSTERPAAIAAAKHPQNASPAAVVSTASTRSASTRTSGRPGRSSRAPRSPCVMMAVPANETSPMCRASDSFGMR
jgi:hypothetical protein